jgi:uncharacterized membrane protein
MAPTISQVLASGGATPSFSYAYFAAFVAAAGAAVVTLVKGMDVYRKGRIISALVENKPSLMEIENQKKVEKLEFLLDALKTEKDGLLSQNEHFHKKIQQLEINRQKEEILHKSNLILARECDKLKAEKEALTLETAKPLIQIKGSAKKTKKGVTRKPKRVSNKKT